MSTKLGPLTQQILYLLIQHGEMTVAQVIAVVGKEISATRASQVGKKKIQYMSNYKRPSRGTKERDISNPKYANEYYVTFGKREIITARLAGLARKGKIRRVRKGVYAPIVVKLYQPNEAV